MMCCIITDQVEIDFGSKDECLTIVFVGSAAFQPIAWHLASYASPAMKLARYKSWI